MKKRALSTVLVLSLLMAFVPFSVPALAYAGGSGTQSDPYIITSEEEFRNIASGYYYALESDLYLSGHTPVGTASARFDGGLDGRGHSIYLNPNRSADNIGLFGAVSNVEIKNLFISGSANGLDNVGMLVGNASGTVEIYNCHVTSGNVSSIGNMGHSGGLVGYNANGSTFIEDSSFNGSVSASAQSVGGLVGWSKYGAISRSFVTGGPTGGTVRGYGFGVGGIAGYSSMTIEQCYTSIRVKNSEQKTGGIVGEMYGGAVRDCYSTGEVSGDNTYVGGIIGHLSSGSVARCYSSGKVESTDGNRVGGIVGYAPSGTEIDYCVAINSSVSGKGTRTEMHRILGGGACSPYDNAADKRIVVNRNSKAIEISDNAYGYDGESVPYAELVTQSLYSRRGWNFSSVWVINPYFGTYPTLRWQIENNSTVALSESMAQVRDGDSFMLTATCVPSSASVRWTVSPAGVVDLSSTTGNTVTVTGIAIGVVTVRASIPGAVAVCEVTVVPGRPKSVEIVIVKVTSYTSPFLINAYEMKAILHPEIIDMTTIENVEWKSTVSFGPGDDGVFSQNATTVMGVPGEITITLTLDNGTTISDKLTLP